MIARIRILLLAGVVLPTLTIALVFRITIANSPITSAGEKTKLNATSDTDLPAEMESSATILDQLLIAGNATLAKVVMPPDLNPLSSQSIMLRPIGNIPTDNRTIIDDRDYVTSSLILSALLQIDSEPLRCPTPQCEVTQPVNFSAHPVSSSESPLFEVTQGVQQPDNSVLLVAHRPTFVRWALTDTVIYTNVNAYLYGSDANSHAPLAGSPIVAYNNPHTLSVNADRAEINSTFNFKLPDAWITNSILLSASALSAYGYRVTTDPNLTNNAVFNFKYAKSLSVTIVPVAYNCTSGGSGTTTPAVPYDYITDFAYRTYPVPTITVAMHVPLPYNGPCNGSGVPAPTSDDWINGSYSSGMLYSVTSLWLSEGSPNSYYYALVHIDCTSGCSSGLGWNNTYKAAVGFDGTNPEHFLAGETYAHQVGHNHGLHHVPGCGTVDSDPNHQWYGFPYLAGLIGDNVHQNFGFDIKTPAIYAYTVYSDFMNFCDVQWVSDYTYEALWLYDNPQTSIGGLNVATSSPTTLGQATAFTATIAAGTNVDFVWKFGDGSLGHGVTVKHTYGAAGSYTVLVTATNSVNVVTATTRITVTNLPVVINPITSLNIAGATTAILGSSYLFMATAGPVTATKPITYVWQATNQLQVIHASNRVTDTISFTWNTTGTKVVTITATNASNTLSAIRQITIGAADPYEPDDTCGQAKTLPTDGTVQAHTFHQQADQDWVAFSAISGTTYLIEAIVPAGSLANMTLGGLYTSCTGLPQGQQDYTFSSGVRFQYSAQGNTSIYLKFLNHTASIYGQNVAYNVSVRKLSNDAQIGALVIVAGKLSEADPLQSNINNTANAVYNLFQQQGYAPDHIYYLATNLGVPGVDALATAANLQAAITLWAADKVDPNHPFTLYLIDHGDYDRLYLDKTHGEWITPTQLDAWLTTLESIHPGVKVNVVVEACQSGSFIDPEFKISRPGRVIISSTGSQNLAWASETGATFSDFFLTGLAQGMSLYSAFQSAQTAVVSEPPPQTPWLDDNGNGIPNDFADGIQAQQRGFNFAGTLADDHWPPYIVAAQGPQSIIQWQGVVSATVLDDIAVRRVWAVVYPPSYQPPATSTEWVRETLPTFVLLSQGNNTYAATYTGFNEIGLYHVMIYAEDDDHLQAQPLALEIRTGWRVFLPILMK
jgi:hypothetical protein